MSGEMPEGWANARIADVFAVNPRKPAADHVRESTPVSFVPMGAVDADMGAITAPEERPFGGVRKGYTAFADGDVLLAKITPCFENGKAAVASSLVNGLGFGSSEFHVFRPQGAVLAPYLFHFLRQPQLRAEIAEFMTGTAGQARVPTDYLRDLELPIAPLAEQRRIVAKVEALLEQVRRAKDRLDRVPLILKRFRQAVLDVASTGQLTADWRAGRGCTSDGDLPTSPLRSLVAELNQGWSPKCENFAAPSGRWAVIKTTAVQPLSFFDAENKQLPADLEPRPELEVRQGDLLITRAGPRVRAGVCCLVRETRPRLMICDKVYRFRVKPSLAIPEFINMALNAPRLVAEIDDLKTGISDSGVNLTQRKFLDMEVTLPPLDEQAEIVRRVDGLFALADAIDQRVERAAARAGSLPQVILSKAFAGELVPTEADLARSEGRDYETAQQLLERVRAQRAESTATAKGPRSASPRGRSRSTSNP